MLDAQATWERATAARERAKATLSGLLEAYAQIGRADLGLPPGSGQDIGLSAADRSRW